MKSTPKVSIIILSFNTKQLIADAIRSVYKQLPEDFFELIIVDNASHDGSPEMIKKEFPKVQVIESKENLGFGRGVNLGAKHAKADYLLFLNSDAQLRDSHVVDMVTFLESHERIGIVGGLLFNLDGTLQRSYAQFYNLPAVIRMLVGGDKAEMQNQNIDKEKRVDWVSGGFMLVKKSLFEKLDGFDNKIFMYIEDMELCYRMKKLGFDTFTYPKATATHLKQGSSNRTFAIVHIFWGLRYFYKKHMSSVEYIILVVLLSLKSLLLVIIGTVTRNTYLLSTYRKTLTNSL